MEKRTKREGKFIENIGIVGIGSGVEAIAAMLVFKKTLKRLVISDIDHGILDGAMENIKNFMSENDLDIEIIPLVGSFCEPFLKEKMSLDILHANIPNLPAKAGEDLTKGAEKGTFVPPELFETYFPNKEYTKWALGAQFAYLSSAKNCVKSGGTILTELGGRIPMQIVRKLFSECDLGFEEVVTGFKEQTEALIDFMGYNALEEREEVRFDFFKVEEARKIMEESSIENPSSEISGEELKALLAPCNVSAGDAIKLYHQGISVGHTVHVFRGIK